MKKTTLTFDKSLNRLSWVMAGVILFDDINTLMGQPASFWRHPETADEFNQLIYFFISRRWQWYCIEQLIYIAGIFILVHILQKKISLVLLMALVLGHFDGGSSWLAHRWHFGTQGMVIYAIVLSIILIYWIYPESAKSKSDMGD